MKRAHSTPERRIICSVRWFPRRYRRRSSSSSSGSGAGGGNSGDNVD